MKKEVAIKILNEVLKELDITPYELSKKLGMNRPQSLYDVLNPEKKVGVSKNLADKICNVFPKFNKSWLLTGEGDMLKSDQSLHSGITITTGRDGNNIVASNNGNATNNSEDSSTDKKQILVLQARIKELENENIGLKAEVDLLREIQGLSKKY